ncbi:hypothetical protein [Nonomuraea sp. NPDC046570]|uniref:hypothetical protein n=1 Tax=Nonomuraea sp. NPDC046570 TaxID=3155255 RepID=UPI0033D5FE6E
MNWFVRRVDNTLAECPDSESEMTFETPALGEAFVFAVVAHCTSLAGGKRHHGGVWVDLMEETAIAHSLVRSVVREVCRRHSAFTPSSAENAANEELRRRFAGHKALRERWSVRVEVGVSEEIREVQREALVEQQKISAKAEADILRLRKLAEVSEVGEAFLSAAKERWIARYAVRLAQGTDDAAVILSELMDERQAGAERLIRLVNEMAAAHKGAGVYDLVIASEGVLRHALKQLGVDVPALESDPLFSSEELAV